MTAILSADRVTKVFRRAPPTDSGEASSALEEVSLVIAPSEVLGVVGESGSGKTTLVRVLGLIEPPSAGSVTFRGAPQVGGDKLALRRFRREVQVVPQDSAGALNPRMTILDSLLEPMRANETAVPKELWIKRAHEVLDLVELPPPVLSRYPHELSGGQRQRVCVSRALALRPSVLLCDEPFSALDVSTQASAINVLRDLKDALNLAVLFVSHDLAVVRQMADRVLVMRRGRVVEQGQSSSVLVNPRHPYSQRLVSATLELERGLKEGRT